jgi:hypothetical protein
LFFLNDHNTLPLANQHSQHLNVYVKNYFVLVSCKPYNRVDDFRKLT